MVDVTMYWTDLVGGQVQIAGQGRQAGRIDDFYYDPTTQSVAALRVQTRLNGTRVLLSSAIISIDRDGAVIANENMLIAETNTGHLSVLPLGSDLLGSQVLNQQGNELGTISNILLGVNPPATLRIAAVEMGRQNARRVSAHAITNIQRNVLTIMD